MDRLAELVHCSEKTIRNDLKVIDDFLKKNSSMHLHRRPGYGIYLQGSVEERERLLSHLPKHRESPREERLIDIAYQLLIADQPVTLQHFANQHFTNKATIKQDLEEISAWLETFHIALISKQRLGVYIEGEEAKNGAHSLIYLNLLPFKRQVMIRL
ncbi:helix-turn-helix domain-containing protein [Bacillus sp. N9]